MGKIVHTLLLMFALFCGCSTPVQARESKLPNIVLIYADDLGYGDVEFLNPDSKIPTPHLNQLAHSGITFTDAHASDTICSPSRYGLLTGRHFLRRPNWIEGMQSSCLID